MPQGKLPHLIHGLMRDLTVPTDIPTAPDENAMQQHLQTVKDLGEAPEANERQLNEIKPGKLLPEMSLIGCWLLSEFLTTIECVCRPPLLRSSLISVLNPKSVELEMQLDQKEECTYQRWDT